MPAKSWWLSSAERKLIRYCLLELRNKLAAEGFDTEDVDAVLRRLLALS